MVSPATLLLGAADGSRKSSARTTTTTITRLACRHWKSTVGSDDDGETNKIDHQHHPKHNSQTTSVSKAQQLLSLSLLLIDGVGLFAVLALALGATLCLNQEKMLCLPGGCLFMAHHLKARTQMRQVSPLSFFERHQWRTVTKCLESSGLPQPSQVQHQW